MRIMQERHVGEPIIALTEVVKSEQQRIVVVIPAYKEERFIGSVVVKARKHADTVIVVDDGSGDATAEIARETGALVVQHEQNQGKGAALNTGFRMARSLEPDVVVTVDADGQHLLEELPLVADPILQGEVDVVVGSRYIQRKSDVPPHRIYGHHAFNFVISQTSGVKVSDSQNGFRAFSSKALDVFVFSSRGFSVESEMQYIARDHGLEVAEVPVTILYTDKPKRHVVSHGMKVLHGLFQMIGQYRPLLFFGVPGLFIMLFGLLWGIWVIDIYREIRELAVGYAMISILLIISGMLALFTGITLHSVRGLILEVARHKNK